MCCPDHILYSACLTKKGRVTGYGSRVFEKFGEICPEQLLRNLAELDWRQRRSGGEDEKCFCRKYGRGLSRSFREAPNSVRSIILSMLKDVALFQPDRVFAAC